MWYLIAGTTLIVIGGAMIVVMLWAKVDAKKEKDMKKFWERMDYADGVINECLSKIESE
jgi:hypothetical protein